MSDNHKESFWTKYIFSIDHKVIGIQYGITALFLILLGFSLMMVMRWQLAYPDTPLPIIGYFMFQDGILTPDMYNSFGAMHGTIMIFLGVVLAIHFDFWTGFFVTLTFTLKWFFMFPHVEGRNER